MTAAVQAEALGGFQARKLHEPQEVAREQVGEHTVRNGHEGCVQATGSGGGGGCRKAEGDGGGSTSISILEQRWLNTHDMHSLQPDIIHKQPLLHSLPAA